MALRFSAPIFTYKNILEKAGVILKISPEKVGKQSEETLVFGTKKIQEEEIELFADGTFKNLSLSKLKELLKKAVLDEDYEVAAKIRDEISKR